MNSGDSLRAKLADIERRARFTKYPQIRDELAAILRKCERTNGSHCHWFMRTAERVLSEEEVLVKTAKEYFTGAALAKHNVLSQKAKNHRA